MNSAFINEKGNFLVARFFGHLDYVKLKMMCCSGTNLKNSFFTPWCWSHRVPPIMKYWCTLKTFLKGTSYLALLRSLVSWAAVKTEIVKTKIILCFLCSIMVWQPESWGFGPQLSGLQVIAWLCIFRIWK